MNQETNIITLKITRDGEYSVKDNLEYKAKSYIRNQLPSVFGAIDNFFTQH